MRRFLMPLLVVGSLLGARSLAQDDAESAVPSVLGFTMSDGSGAGRELDAAVGKIRGTYEEKAVLFFSVNLSTAGGRHQGEMLFYALGLKSVWDDCRKAPGKLVLVDFDSAEVVARLSPKDNFAKAIDAHLSADDDEGYGGDEGCGCGEDEGCGCGD